MLTYIPPVYAVLLAALAAAAAYYDVQYRRVPNWLVLIGLVLGFGLNTFVFEAAGFMIALKGFGLATIVYFPLYLLRGMGAGDVKLMMALGAILGPGNWFGLLVVTSLFGAVAGLALAAYKRRLGTTFANTGFIVRALAHRLKPYEGRPDLDVTSSSGLRLPHAAVIGVAMAVLLVINQVFAPR